MGFDDLGNPLTDTAYSLCAYDSRGAQWSLVASFALPIGPPWVLDGDQGYRYRDRSGALGGVSNVRIRTSAGGVSRILFRAAGDSMPLAPAAGTGRYFDQQPSVVVELVAADGRCWTSDFSPATTRSNTATLFRATHD
jgi:hypothetical protein